MDLDDLVIPEEKKALLVIHEENMHEAESKEEDDKCKFLETKNHRRVLEKDITILEQYQLITISRKEKELGFYVGEKRKIPDDANALIVVGETKNFHKYLAKYCKLIENITVGDNKKKKNWFFPLGLFSVSSMDFKKYFNF